MELLPKTNQKQINTNVKTFINQSVVLVNFQNF